MCSQRLMIFRTYCKKTGSYHYSSSPDYQHDFGCGYDYKFAPKAQNGDFHRTNVIDSFGIDNFTENPILLERHELRVKILNDYQKNIDTLWRVIDDNKILCLQYTEIFKVKLNEARPIEDFIMVNVINEQN